MGGRGYITVRVLVLIVSCLVALEYFSLLQTTDNADKPRPNIFRIHSDGNGAWHRHVLSALPLELYRTDPALMSYPYPVSVNQSQETIIPTNISLSPSQGSISVIASPGLVPALQMVSSSSSLASSSASNYSGQPLSDCPMIPPNLHGRFPVTINEVPTEMEEIEALFPDLEAGGRWRPPDCKARHKVAVIVPYRDREEHLRIFLYNLHKLLQRQQNEYGIYVIEQSGNGPFNRAMLMNVGAAESLKQYEYSCFIFHDVDLLPEDDRNLYTCPIQPRHMSVAVDSFSYRLPYDDIFGGVSAMTVDQFRLVNGFSNYFWGWGGEDDDMANRLRLKKLFISRYPANIARYRMLKHGKEKANPERFKILYTGAKRVMKDGYNSLKYRRVEFKLKKLYTWVLVDLPHIKS